MLIFSISPVSLPASTAQCSIDLTFAFSKTSGSQVFLATVASTPRRPMRVLTPEKMAVAVPALSGTCRSVLYVWEKERERDGRR